MKPVNIQRKLKVALPAGSLKEATLELLRKAGFKISLPDRTYIPQIDDSELECMFIRAQEIPRYIEQGKFDMGITGKDWIEETEAAVEEIAELKYSKYGLNAIRLVLAVPENSPIRKLSDLNGKTIATELVNVTKKFLVKNNVKADVEYSWGATEAKPPMLADAIAELTDRGTSLRANNLRIVAEILTAPTKMIANKKSNQDPWKKQKIKTLALLIQSALDAKSMVGLKLNVSTLKLKEILACLPALRNPTISPLSQKGWCSVESVLPEKDVKEIIPKLIILGATGIIEYPLNKIIY